MITKLGIVILNWNSHENAVRAAMSVFACNDAAASVFIVDNDSELDPKSYFDAKISARFTYIQAGANIGWAAGNNLGIRAALKDGCYFVLLLNPDVVKSYFCCNFWDGMRLVG